MSELEVRARLERALGRIAVAEWMDLEEQGFVRDYQEGELPWSELRGLVDEALTRLRRHVERVRREQAGEPLLETEISERAPEPTGVPDIPIPTLSERTAARAGALIALDNYELGPTNPDRVRSRTIRSKVRPQGGFDDTLPQWVIELKIEAWVPADDVRNIYQDVQRDLLAENGCPKTQPRTYNVARFVWEEELRHGKRPSWSVLLERWNERYPDDRFNDQQAFYMCFKRGAKATPPRYAQSNDQITSAARRLQRAKERWEEGGPWFGLGPSVSRQF